MKISFFLREKTEHVPKGITVSRKPELPKGNFKITEYHWGSTSLWFIDKDNFTADERESVYQDLIEWIQLPEPQQWGRPERDEEYNHEDKELEDDNS